MTRGRHRGLFESAVGTFLFDLFLRHDTSGSLKIAPEARFHPLTIVPWLV